MRNHLLDIARRGRTTTYSVAGALLGLDMDSPADRNRISELLDEISVGEHEAGRPLLSVVVIRNDHNLPGDGFFKMAKRVEKQRGNPLRCVWEFYVPSEHLLLLDTHGYRPGLGLKGVAARCAWVDDSTFEAVARFGSTRLDIQWLALDARRLMAPAEPCTPFGLGNGRKGLSRRRI